MVQHCDDKSDEYECYDECKGFTCKNGQCILEYLACNGWRYCDDLSDEEDCGMLISVQNQKNRATLD